MPRRAANERAQGGPKLHSDVAPRNPEVSSASRLPIEDIVAAACHDLAQEPVCGTRTCAPVGGLRVRFKFRTAQTRRGQRAERHAKACRGSSSHFSPRGLTMATTDARPLSADPKTGFLKDICAYFRDFLDTDFKRQASPKRSIALKDAAGNLTGIDVAKYPNLANEIWQLLRKPVTEGMAFSLAVPRGKFEGRIKRGMVDLIDKQVKAISDEEFAAIADRASANARESKRTFENDPDQYKETVTSGLRSDILRTVIVPLLRKLEPTLAEARGEAFESIYNIEEELSEALIEQAREPIGAALATVLAEKSFSEFDALARDIVDPEIIHAKITNYFESFVTADFFQELHQLTSTLKLRENFETYLYVCDLRFNSASYPLFYLSLSV